MPTTNTCRQQHSAENRNGRLIDRCTGDGSCRNIKVPVVNHRKADRFCASVNGDLALLVFEPARKRLLDAINQTDQSHFYYYVIIRADRLPTRLGISRGVARTQQHSLMVTEDRNQSVWVFASKAFRETEQRPLQ